jgi:hypothetical protein
MTSVKPLAAPAVAASSRKLKDQEVYSLNRSLWTLVTQAAPWKAVRGSHTPSPCMNGGNRKQVADTAAATLTCAVVEVDAMSQATLGKTTQVNIVLC